MKFGPAKIGTALVWLLVIANLFVVFPGWLATTLHWLGIALVVVHVGEFIVFNKQIMSRNESPVVAFIMTFFFGIFYWRDIP